MLRRAIAASGGTEVKNLGDGLMVAFASSSAALACAVGMQQAVERANRESEAQLGLRVGLSGGEATREGDDYFGDPVIEASRLCAAASGGQILASELVRAMAGRRTSVEFRSVGQRALKGLPELIETVEVVWEPEAETAGGGGVPLPARLQRDDAAGFFGRDAERVVLADALKDAANEQRLRVVLIGGEPGIGKTTLAIEAVCRARESGATVLYGRSDEDLGISYQPWIEALGHLVDHAPDPLIEAHVGEYGGELVRLVPQLARRRPDLPAPRASDPETERYLLFGAVLGLLRAAAHEMPVVMVFDDLHWADKPTLLLLRHLVSAREPTRLLLIGTFRESEVSADHALADTLAALHREEGVERVSLRGLDSVELLELMSARAGYEISEDGVAFAHALRRETDGNPFFVAEMLLHLAESGAIFERDGRWVASDDLRESGLPVSVREVIGRRVARLGEATVRLLGVAAVIGRDFDASLVATVAEVDDDELVDLLDRAVDAALVEEVPGAPGRYTFAHALIEHTIYGELSASRRARTHRQVAEALEAAWGTRDPGDRLGELAYHWIEATAPQDAVKTIDFARRAAERALVQLAPDEALRWYSQTVELYDRAALSDERLRCELLVGLGEAQWQAGVAGAREALLDASRLAQRLGYDDLLVRAALANTRGFFSDARGVDADRVAVLESALNVAGDDLDRAKLLAVLAAELLVEGDYPKRRALVDEALALARRADDPATLAFVLTIWATTLNVPDTLAERTRIVDELDALADELDDPQVESDVHGHAYACAMEQGDSEVADLAQLRRNEIVGRLGRPGPRWGTVISDSAGALRRGDPAGAEALADESLRFGTESGQPDAFSIYGALLIAVRWHQGRLAELEPIVAQVAADTPGVPGFVAELAHCRIEGGDEGGARELLDLGAADGFASVPYDLVWATTLALWAEVAAHLGAVPPAAVLADRLRPYRGLVVFNGASTFGPIADYLGMLEAVLGNYEQADASFDQAMAIHQRFQAPFFLARTHLHRAQLCARRAAPADAEHGPQLLAETLILARRHGYAGLEREAVALDHQA